MKINNPNSIFLQKEIEKNMLKSLEAINKIAVFGTYGVKKFDLDDEGNYKFEYTFQPKVTLTHIDVNINL